MKVFSPIFLSFILLGCQSPPPDLVDIVGCAHNHELPPLSLTNLDKKLLSSQSTPPQTITDYYLLLDQDHYSIMESSRERRVTYINKETLTDRYLEAEQWFECDGGGFELTLRLFNTASGDILAVSSSSYDSIKIYDNPDAPRGKLESITVSKPRFYKYEEGQLKSIETNILPLISRDFVLNRYYNYYKAHLKHPRSSKFIWLTYDLPKKGRDIEVKGRENFMDPFENYIWKSYTLPSNM